MVGLLISDSVRSMPGEVLAATGKNDNTDTGIRIKLFAGRCEFCDQLFVKSVQDGRTVHPDRGDLAGTFDFKSFVHG